MFPTTLCENQTPWPRGQTGFPENRILNQAQRHTPYMRLGVAMCLGTSARRLPQVCACRGCPNRSPRRHGRLHARETGPGANRRRASADADHCRRWITRSDAWERIRSANGRVRAMMASRAMQNASYTSPGGADRSVAVGI